MPEILIAEDDRAIQNLLKLTLREAGYGTAVCGTAREAVDACVSKVVDLVILDLGLPDMDGMYVIESLRSWTQALPILVVSARGSDPDKVRALDAGANDYIQKPFSTAELLARVRVLLRNRAGDSEASVFVNGALKIDYAEHSVYLSGEEVRLTNYEYKILSLLAQNVGKTLTHNYMISHVWGTGGNDVNGLRVFMAGIRRKIETAPYAQEFIRTDVGIGYRMNRLSD